MSETEVQNSETKSADPETIEPAGETVPPAGETIAVEDDPDIEVTYRDRHLERDMTDEERLKVGHDMAEALEESERLEAQKKAYDADLKGQISRLQERAATLAKALRKGKREGNVQVTIVKNWHNGSITVTREDTGEVIEDRAMTFEERQRTLLNGDTTTAVMADRPVQVETIEPEAPADSQSPVEALALTAGKAGNA